MALRTKVITAGGVPLTMYSYDGEFWATRIEDAQKHYRRTVIAAYEEVESAVVNLAAHRQQQVELQAQVDQLTLVAAQTAVQLKAGMISQLVTTGDGHAVQRPQFAAAGNLGHQ